MRTIYSDQGPTKSRQKGVALVMSMAFLLILTLIGISAMNSSALEERMAGNMVDKNYALQAAESALLAGEAVIPGLPEDPRKAPVPNDGFHMPSITATPRWNEVGIWTGTDHVSYAGLSKVKSQPKFIVESMGEITTGSSVTTGGGYGGGGGDPDMTIFRITARGTGGTDNAVTMVQSTFEVLF